MDEHAVIVNFIAPIRLRFRRLPVPARGVPDRLRFGLDNFSLSSFGLRYGVTDKLSVDVWRSPSFIGRPIQLMAAYNMS